MANWASLESIRNESSFFQHSSNASPPPPSHGQSLDSRISPSILLIIVILAVIFFISGLLHLLVRFLVKPSRRENDDSDDVSALQGQLQQLFHLHDAGVDQSFIDALPVFLYKTIIGVKNPFDCAVCLCEFEEEDKLRLLPKCSHAFHLECIDTWLLSHSTCPLCRGSLLPDLQSNCCSPIVLVLESRSGSSREITDGDSISSARLDLSSSGDLIRVVDNSEKPVEKNPSSEETEVVSVKLGKLRNVIDGVRVIGSSIRVVGEGSSHLTTVDSRRCYSMGYFEYVLDEASLLQVPIAPMKRKRLTEKPSYAMAATSRLADSSIVGQGKRESFSISKIWLRSKRERVDPLRRAFSYRLPVQRVDDMMKLKELRSCSQRTVSEIEVEGWVNGYDRVGSSSLPTTSDENGLNGKSCHSFHSIDAGLQRNPTPPSFARRTLNWIVGRSQNRVMHSAPLPPSSLI